MKTDNSKSSPAGIEAMECAMRCWRAASGFRETRNRNKLYTFGDQWKDRIWVDGQYITEETYIRSQGNQPLKNNLIRRIVRNVTGVFRNSLKERLDGRDEDGRMHDSLNRMEELYSRTMEEFLISGLAVHRKWFGTRDGIRGVWTESVAPDSFFFDPTARDPRGTDISVIGQIHETPLESFCAAFCGSDPRRYAEYRERYGKAGRVRFAEIWRRERRERLLVHDTERATLVKADKEVWLRNHSLRVMPSRWFLEDVWRFRFVTEEGEILAEGDSPYATHPYVFKAYPFLDGEIHSFVDDIIDQQRFTNRLITMYDWVVRASAKGVLLVPEDCIPDGGGLEEIAGQWSRFNGVITYKTGKSNNAPHQVSGGNTPAGIGDLLSIQLKMMEDVSGVNGAIQGRLDNKTVSGALYTQQTENSLTSLRDILDSFNAFITASFRLEERMSGKMIHNQK